MTTKGKILNSRSGISEKNGKRTPYVICQVQEEDGTQYNVAMFGSDVYDRRDQYKPNRPVTLKTGIDFRFNGTIEIVI